MSGSIVGGAGVDGQAGSSAAASRSVDSAAEERRVAQLIEEISVDPASSPSRRMAIRKVRGIPLSTLASAVTLVPKLRLLGFASQVTTASTYLPMLFSPYTPLLLYSIQPKASTTISYRKRHPNERITHALPERLRIYLALSAISRDSAYLVLLDMHVSTLRTMVNNVLLPVTVDGSKSLSIDAHSEHWVTYPGSFARTTSEARNYSDIFVHC